MPDKMVGQPFWTPFTAPRRGEAQGWAESLWPVFAPAKPALLPSLAGVRRTSAGFAEAQKKSPASNETGDFHFLMPDDGPAPHLRCGSFPH
jgi:hypothetical protein